MRPKLEENDKKQPLSITIDKNVNNYLNEMKIKNKSKLINKLLISFLSENGYKINEY